ncbi:PH domain-containing protein [Desulfurococcaceae archaeon MEX13E-LK6-19]|nr:PH domain-containing protein [Desulfurococcaceae archaeon MEX13E-LK6-19]
MFELKEREFKPSPKMKTIYWLYSLWYFIPVLLLILAFGAASVEPVVSRHGLDLTSRQVVETIMMNILIPIIVFVLIPALIFGIWVSLYYKSILFRVEEDHVYSRKGIWWVKEKRVPYNLISEVRLRQGPLQRRLGLANIDIFTPATGVQRPELSLFQIDALRAQEVLSYLRYKTGILSSKERKVIEEDMLKELREIRRLLEEILDRL